MKDLLFINIYLFFEKITLVKLTFSMNSLNKFICVSVVAILFLVNSLKAQSFYNFDNFIADSAFVTNNKVKSITMRIPTLLDDTTNKDFIPFQKTVFQSFR